MVNKFGKSNNICNRFCARSGQLTTVGQQLNVGEFAEWCEQCRFVEDDDHGVEPEMKQYEDGPLAGLDVVLEVVGVEHQPLVLLRVDDRQVAFHLPQLLHALLREIVRIPDVVEYIRRATVEMDYLDAGRERIRPSLFVERRFGNLQIHVVISQCDGPSCAG